MRELDLRAEVAAHPWRAVAIAFAAGAALGVRPRTLFAATAIAMLRDVAAAHAASYARSWLDERIRRYAA